MSSSNNKKDSSQKKRKMWRTVNVSAGGGPPQSMTPEAAAKYIQQAASQSASRNGSGREVKISFGPSRPPNGRGSSKSINLGNLDLQALKETAAAAAAAGKPKGSKNKDGLPCTESEMKALMGMFVEIMGMSMDSEKMRKAANNKNGPVFMFGNSDGIPMPPMGGWTEQTAKTMAAATAGFFADQASWQALQRTYGSMMNEGSDDDDDDDDDDDEDDDGSDDDYDEDEDDGSEDDEDDDEDEDDSLPNMDDMRQLFQAHQKSHFEAMARSRMNANGSFNNQDIPPSDWESLEQVAMDDALEAEERARRAAKKKEKKQRKKQKLKEEAAQKVAEAAMKKKEKAILSWRSRVVSACQSGEDSKLDALLLESPLRKMPDEESLSRSYILPHLEFLLPNSVAKNRSVLNRGQEARKKLAEYILCQDIPVVFTPLRSGRTVMHKACFHGDMQFLKLALDRLRDYEDTENRIPSNYLDQTCAESGWSLLHYASVSGSKEILEMLLQEGCNVATITDDTHTWRKSDGKGVTARELTQYIHRNEHEKLLETHGLALQDIINTFCSNHAERKTFQSNIHRVLMRLTDIEANGYSPPKQNSAREENEISNDPEQENHESASSRKRKKKKKKKQAQKAAEEAKEEAEKSVATQEEEQDNDDTEEKDPLVLALMGMGFSEQQINAGVNACGGPNRATADDVVTWILGQDADGNDNSSSGPMMVHEAEITAETTIKTVSFEQVQKTDPAAREQEDAAKRLAAKREEQRRRNRAWNDSQQSRLTEATKVKPTIAVMPQRPVVAPPPTAAYAAAYPPLQSTMSSGSSAGAAAAPSVASKPAPKAAAAPKTIIVPKKILSKPVATAAKKAPPPAVKPAPSVKAAKNEKPAAVPTILKKPEVEKPSPMEMPKAAPQAAPPPTKQPPPKLESPPEIRNVVKDQPIEAKPVPILAQPMIPASNGAFSLPSGLPVSSIPLMIPPPSSAPPPPGFMAPTPPPPPSMPQPGVSFPPLNTSFPSNGMRLPVDPGQFGEIRATAKAFVPTSFASSVPAGNPGMPPLSHSFANPQASSGMPPLGGAPEGKSLIQSAFAPNILSGGLGGPPGVMDVDSFDRMPSMTPISTDSTTNTTTSLSGFEESGLAGLPLGFGMDIPQPTGGTSSLLDTFASAAAPVDPSSLWDGHQGGAALDAFSSLGLGDVGADDSQYDDNRNNANATLWGGALGGNPAPGNLGSIW